MKTLTPLLLAALASAAHNWDDYRLGSVDNFPWTNPMPADGGTLNGYVLPCGGTLQRDSVQALRPPRPTS